MVSRFKPERTAATPPDGQRHSPDTLIRSLPGCAHIHRAAHGAKHRGDGPARLGALVELVRLLGRAAAREAMAEPISDRPAIENPAFVNAQPPISKTERCNDAAK